MSAALSKTTLVARRLSVHFQNIITPTESLQKCVDDINHDIAVFREMLIILGQEKDCPELRIKIRKYRCKLVEECQKTAQLLISLTSNGSNEYLENKNHFFILLFHLMQLFLRELNKSHRLIEIINMDMGEYFDNRSCAFNLGNVISEIILLKRQQKPDFILEELTSITLAAKQITLLIQDIEIFVPRELNTNTDLYISWPKKFKHKLFCCSALSC